MNLAIASHRPFFGFKRNIVDDFRFVINSIYFFYNDLQHLLIYELLVEDMLNLVKDLIVFREQCAWIVHNNGKCLVKKGSYEELKPICNALNENGLSAQIH